jgi:hypothetical protein
MANIANTLIASEVAARLNGLAQDCAAWENGSYKASNEDLYALLDSCFTLIGQMKDQRHLIVELNAQLEAKKIVFNKGTSLTTKVTRFVFNGAGKRITGYARVLRVATNEKRENESFAAFVKRKGGIEEVRKQKDEGTVSRAEQTLKNIKVAEAHFVSSDALVQEIACAAPGVHPNGETEHYFSAALIRKNDDGSLSIVYGCNKDSVVRLLLSEGGKETVEMLKDQAAAGLLRQQRQQRDAVVDSLAS